MIFTELPPQSAIGLSWQLFSSRSLPSLKLDAVTSAAFSKRRTGHAETS
jgi:hypothetical protein